MTSKNIDDVTLVFDLNKFASDLPKEHWDIKKKIRRWKDAHSISADLILAWEMLNIAVQQHHSKRKKMTYSKMSLVHSAVMTYARALERHSNHRGKISVAGNFTAKQSAFHEVLIGLRDEALAHYGHAGTITPWNSENTVMIQEGDMWQPVTVARRRLFESEFVGNFIVHLEEVNKFVDEQVEIRRAELQSLLKRKILLDEVSRIYDSAKMSQSEVDKNYRPILQGVREGRKIGNWHDDEQ